MTTRKWKADNQQCGDKVSPETIELKQFYTFNVAPDDDAQDWGSTLRDHSVFHAYENLIHSSFGPENYHVILYQEVSRNGRIHYHGVIKFETPDAIHDFYVKKLHNMEKHNRIEIDTIEDVEVWE
jgi:hypothetical protein